VPNAQAAIVVDGRDGEVMWAKRPGTRRQIASTTKLMTALLTLERTRPRQVFRAADYDAAPIESQIGLRPGERMRVADLFEALLLESANDAAVTLAEGVSGSTGEFVAEMNRRAAELGLEDTSYANPIGLDDPANYSTAHDLATLAFVLMQRARFARVVDLPAAELESGARPRVVENRNTLIASYPFVNGVKTGHTSLAGYVLIGSARASNGGRVISVVLGEPSEPGRDADTLKLLRWGLGQFQRVRVLDPRRALARAEIEYFDDEEARLVPQRGVVLTLRDGQRVDRIVKAPDQLEGPLPARDRVGSATVTVDGERVRRVPLVTAAEVPEAGTLRVLVSVLGVPLTVLAVLAILLVVALLALRLRARIRLVKR
jgi:D-alanyl-D-alanine carboxypeptidase (penicillin-binding protein 5/6)